MHKYKLFISFSVLLFNSYDGGKADQKMFGTLKGLWEKYYVL